MSNNRIRQKLVVPLFNAELEEPIQLVIAKDEFVRRMTFNIFPKPIPLFKNVNEKPENKPIQIPFPVPQTTIFFYPWDSQGEDRYGISSVIPPDQLPNGFDVFDNLGIFAFRSGPSSSSSFQTITQVQTGRRAKVLLIIEFNQSYPDDVSEVLFSQNPYEFNFIESLLDAIRLVSGNEPHQYKGFHLNDDQLMDVIIKWPLAEIQGQPLRLKDINLKKLKEVLLGIWRIRSTFGDSKGYRILTTALGYYYLSSTLTEYRTIFLYLIIAFEALFKTQYERSASTASMRMAKLLANTKADYKDIKRFVFNTRRVPGCYQIRNQIIHGESNSPPKEMFWRLRDYLRIAILRVIDMLLSFQIDRDTYYETLSDCVNSRFSQLPDK